MALQILKGDRKKEEQRIGRYMREIRAIVNAGFSRRELLRMGLVLGGAGLAAMHGMRGFRPYWAHAASGSGLILASPPNTPTSRSARTSTTPTRARASPAPIRPAA